MKNNNPFLPAAAMFATAILPAIADDARPDAPVPVSDDGGRTVAFVRDALARGEREVNVPPVRARIAPGAEGAYFVFRGLNDTVVDFQGCDFFGTRRVRALSLQGCTNVTVRNLTFDYDPLPFTQARITAVDAEGNWDLEVVDGYEAPPAECQYWPMQVYDKRHEELANEMRSGAGFRLEKTGERTYRATGGQNRTGEVGDIAAWSVRDEGAFPEPCTVLLEDSAGCTLENVALYSTSHGFGFFELRCSGNVYRNCTLDRRPPETDIRARGVRRLRSGNHDAFHSKGASIGPVLDGCRFAYQCDDAVNLGAYCSIVTSAGGGRAEVAEKTAIPFEVPMRLSPAIRAGDTLQVIRRDGSNGPDVHVEAVEGRKATAEAQFAFLKTLGMWPGKEREMAGTSLLRLREGETLAPGDAVVPERMLCRGFAIRNCRFGPNRALGMRIRASDGVIESNAVTRTVGAGLSVGPEIEWPEGPMGHDLTIRGNVFTACGVAGGQPSLCIGGHAAGRRDVAPDAHRGMVVVDNRITGSGRGMDLRGCAGAVVEGNTVVAPGENLRGVQLPMRNLREDDFDTMEAWGVKLIRYQMTREFMRRGYGEGGKEGYDKWLAGKIDHLLGFVIPQCRKRGMKVVVDLHDAPGGRLPDCLDWALYYDREKLDHFFDCWRTIAERTKGNEDAVYGYDLMNEPVQTREPTTMDYWDVQAEAAKIVREIDPKTPIVIESNGWDSPLRFPELKPLPMENVIYQSHMYGPNDYCQQGVGGRAQDAAWHWPDPEKGWTRDYMRNILKDVREFERKYNAKIYIGEFSVAAWATGGDNWLRDVIAVFDEFGWDWTYHAFREWQPWSVEHEGPDKDHMVRSEDNPRKRALIEGIRGL